MIIQKDASAVKLMRLVDQDFETNRLIAAHENADGPILDAVSAFRIDDEIDIETIRLCLKHRNVTLRIIMQFGDIDWRQVIVNPAFDAFIGNGALELEMIPGLLKSEYCPPYIIDMVVDGCNERSNLYLLQNQKISESVRGKILEKSFDLLMNRFDIAIVNSKRQEVKDFLEAWRQTPRVVFLPIFLDHSVDRENIKDRLSDQLVNGSPFTSSSWPWPVNDNQVAKQPLLQINLETASNNLGINLGVGVLQIWMDSVEEEISLRGQFGNIEIRIIPKSDCYEFLEDLSPVEGPWDELFDEYMQLDGQSSPRVKWVSVGIQLPFMPMGGWSQSTRIGKLAGALTEDEFIEYFKEIAPNIHDSFEVEYVQFGGYPQVQSEQYFESFGAGFDRNFEDGVHLIFNFQCKCFGGDLSCGLALFATIKDGEKAAFECVFAGFSH